MSIKEKINNKKLNWFRLEKDYFCKNNDLFEKYYDICNVEKLYQHQTLDQNFIRKYQEKTQNSVTFNRRKFITDEVFTSEVLV